MVAVGLGRGEQVTAEVLCAAAGAWPDSLWSAQSWVIWAPEANCERPVMPK
jgi:hypothetical protein